ALDAREPEHVLRQLLPRDRQLAYRLRDRHQQCERAFVQLDGWPGRAVELAHHPRLAPLTRDLLCLREGDTPATRSGGFTDERATRLLQRPVVGGGRRAADPLVDRAECLFARLGYGNDTHRTRVADLHAERHQRGEVRAVRLEDVPHEVVWRERACRAVRAQEPLPRTRIDGRHLVEDRHERVARAPRHVRRLHGPVPREDVILDAREVAVAAAILRERDRDEPVDAAREYLCRPGRVHGKLTRSWRLEEAARQVAQVHRQAIVPTARCAVTCVVAAHTVAPQRDLPVQIVRDLVCDRTRRRGGWQQQATLRRVVHRERRHVLRAAAEVYAQTAHVERGHDEPQVAEREVEHATQVRPPRRGNRIGVRDRADAVALRQLARGGATEAGEPDRLLRVAAHADGAGQRRERGCDVVRTRRPEQCELRGERLLVDRALHERDACLVLLNGHPWLVEQLATVHTRSDRDRRLWRQLHAV